MIHQYIPDLLAFKTNCAAAGVEIPFIFHAGETLQDGGSTDLNLADALMLGCKRVGHGYALIRHPELMRRYKERGISIECCPIGNEILHLTPTIGGHAIYTLMANNVRCTISCDNSIFYR